MLLIGSAATEEWRPPTVAESFGLLYLALPLTVGAFLMWYTGLRRLGVARAGMFAGILPVATLAATSLLDLRLPGPLAVAGTALVAAGLLIGSWLLSARLPVPLRHRRVPRAATRPRHRHHPRRPPAATAPPARHQPAAGLPGPPAGSGRESSRPAPAPAAPGRSRPAPSPAPSPPS